MKEYNVIAGRKMQYLLALITFRSLASQEKNKRRMIQKTYLKTKDQCKVKFTISIENAERVEILGLNGDWNTPIKMSRKKNGTFECVQTLPRHTQHEFKYLVDGTEWRNDPDADGEAPNEYGGTNTLLVL